MKSDNGKEFGYPMKEMIKNRIHIPRGTMEENKYSTCHVCLGQLQMPQ